jgi:hypothetical protein
VHDIALLTPFVLATLSKFPGVSECLPHVMNALALTGGHARTVEAMMDSLANQSSLANSKISRALSEVRATLTTRYGNRVTACATLVCSVAFGCRV